MPPFLAGLGRTLQLLPRPLHTAARLSALRVRAISSRLRCIHAQLARFAMHNNHQKEHLYKILVIGDLGVGKTSIIKRYVHHNFSPNYRATIGVDFALKVLNWDQETVRLQLWDIAGTLKFNFILKTYIERVRITTLLVLYKNKDNNAVKYIDTQSPFVN